MSSFEELQRRAKNKGIVLVSYWSFGGNFYDIYSPHGNVEKLTNLADVEKAIARMRTVANKDKILEKQRLDQARLDAKRMLTHRQFTPVVRAKLDDLVKNYDEFTTSDLQGVVMGMALNDPQLDEDEMLEYIEDKVHPNRRR